MNHSVVTSSQLRNGQSKSQSHSHTNTMKLSLIVTTLSSLLLSAVVHAERYISSLRGGLKGGNYFALIGTVPDEEISRCMASALGKVVAMVRNDRFCIKLSSSDDLGNQELFSHAVHGPAAVGESGPVIFTINTSTDKTQCFDLTKDQMRDLDDELWYFNIHSEKRPHSAVRGQILPLASNVGTIVQHLRKIPAAA
jgi:hypothetical protein